MIGTTNAGAAGTPIEDVLLVDNIVLDNVTVAASGYDTKDLEVERNDGFVPIGVVGFSVTNATNSGTGASYINVRTAGLYVSTADNVTYMQFSYRNANSSQAKIRITGKVLYMKPTVTS